MWELGQPARARGPVAQIPWSLANGWLVRDASLATYFLNPFRRLNKKVKKSKIGY